MRLVALVWICVILVLMPLQAIWSRRKVQKLRPTRMRAYASTISGLILILMGAITFVVDWFSGRTGVQAAKTVMDLMALSAWARRDRIPSSSRHELADGVPLGTGDVSI